jgi:GMP synthase-like glutamine amidotransferase
VLLDAAPDGVDAAGSPSAIRSGARLLAHTLGAATSQSPINDGYAPPSLAPVVLTDEGCVDRVLGAAETDRRPSPLGEHFALPDPAVVLATSPATSARTFRHHRAYGRPFHVEVDTNIATDWGIPPAPETEADPCLHASSRPLASGQRPATSGQRQLPLPLDPRQEQH